MVWLCRIIFQDISERRKTRYDSADEITMDSSFVDDLGADSVDLVELVMAMEEEFDIGEIEEEDLTGLKTVGDCVKYLTNKINN